MDWKTWPFWDQIGRVAPVVTAGVATIAATIAIFSLFTQIRIARKRAAIDNIFLKTEMDDAMLKAYRAYKAGLKASEKFASADEFAENNYEEYMAVRQYLDVNELICIGINQNVFDQRVCYGFWSNILSDAAAKGAEIIQHARKPQDGGHNYDHILDVRKRWAGRPRFWQCWRR